jgi:hypothetical protein
MPPLSTSAISALAEALLSQIAPQCLTQPTPLPVLEIVEDVLPEYGIHTYAVDDSTLPEEEALTDPFGRDGETVIRVRDSVYTDLVQGSRLSYRPRVTVMHEVGHAVMHVPVIRRRIQHAPLTRLLQRLASADVKPYESSEWQAYAFSGFILMPAAALRQFDSIDVATISEAFQVSERMVRSHLTRALHANLLGNIRVDGL